MSSVANVAYVAGDDLPLRPPGDLPPSGPDGPPWPDPLRPAALRGLPGAVVRSIEPHSEADLAAILFQFLIAAGSVIGRNAYFLAEADRHFPNLFGVLVGRSSKGRKGSSWGQVRRVVEVADASWNEDCVVHGLSSGEGLIWAVRDAVEQQQPVKEKGRVTEYQTVVIDHGVTDKRLLVVESEMATVLKVAKREGNTLSPIIRMAWDTGDLRTLTKNSPARATGAHVSIIGHITQEELLRYFDNTEAANGFGNRFLWICARRSKLLPDGGMLKKEQILSLGVQLADAVAYARTLDVVGRDDDAKKLWHDVYPELSHGRPGLLGAVTGRSEANVMRLATLYAILDRSGVIRRTHLESGLAAWRYAEQSARYIFGDALGNPVADEILSHLRTAHDGLTRTQIRDIFKGHKTAAQINRALTILAENNLAFMETAPTRGRPIERWFAAVRGATKATEATKAPSGASDPDLSSPKSLLSHDKDEETDGQSEDVEEVVL